MQPYRDNPFSDSNVDLHNTGAHDIGTAGHQYSAPSSGFQAIPLVPPSNQGQYSSVLPRSESAANVGAGADGTRPTSLPQWDSSRYGQGSAWLEEKEKQSKRSKIVVIICAVGLAVIIAVSVSVGVVFSRRNSNSSQRTSSNNSTTNPDAVNQTDPNDPSSFVRDPNLHQAFYGMAYTPVGSLIPECGNKLEDVIQDMQLLSQITKRIRLYGADCNQSALVLEAIKRTKVDMTVWLGNYVLADDNNVAYERQRDTIKQAITDYGVDHIGGVTVGNEFMLNYLNDNGGTEPNTPVGDRGAQILIANIKDTADMISGMNLPKHIPVGTSDAGSYFNTQVLQAVEYGMANVHPWFANVTAEASAAWTTQFFQETNVDVARGLANQPTMYIAETGWPTKSSDVSNANNGASDASEANLQIFIDTFVCQANSAGIGYFFFEFCDEDWKDKQFGGVEGWWGLFNQNRTLKNIRIPSTCQTP